MCAARITDYASGAGAKPSSPENSDGVVITDYCKENVKGGGSFNEVTCGKGEMRVTRTLKSKRKGTDPQQIIEAANKLNGLIVEIKASETDLYTKLRELLPTDKIFPLDEEGGGLYSPTPENPNEYYSTVPRCCSIDKYVTLLFEKSEEVETRRAAERIREKVVADVTNFCDRVMDAVKIGRAHV